MNTINPSFQETAGRIVVKRAKSRRGRTALKEAFYRTVFEPIHHRFLVTAFRQIVGNPGLHILVLKLYSYGDGNGAVKIGRFAKLLQDPELRSKYEKHATDEAKHAALFRQRALELGGSPTLTPAELSLGFFDRVHSNALGNLGISDERLDSNRFFDAAEMLAFLSWVKSEEEIAFRIFLAHIQAADRDPQTKRVLEEVIEDERHHVAFLAEELEKLSQSGPQPLVSERDWRFSSYIDIPTGMRGKTLLTMLDMFHFQPVGRVARVLWFFLSPLTRMARKKRDE